MRDKIGYQNPYNIDTSNDRNWWVNPDIPEIVFPITKALVKRHLQAHGIPQLGLRVTIRGRSHVYSNDNLVDLICDSLKTNPYSLFPPYWINKTLNEHIGSLAKFDATNGGNRLSEAIVEWA